MLADLKFTLRSLLKTPGLVISVLATLTLCIGANTAIFSMLYALVIKPLPFREPTRIVEVYNVFPKAGLDKTPSNIAQYVDFKEHAPAFAHLGLWQLGEFTLGDKGGPARIEGAVSTADMFEVLGVKPLLGRFFTAENHEPGAHKVVVLTQSFWESRFHEDPGVLGKTLRLDGEIFEIIGVAPHVFEAFDARAKFVRPMSWPGQYVNQFPRYGVSPNLYGRLKTDASLNTAYAQVAAIEKRYYDTADPGTREFLDRTGHIMGVDTVQAQRVGPVKTALYLLQAGVLFVLLIGCLNVANLLLARSNARQGEFATRVALGARRFALARPLLLESALLTGVGAVLGLLLAWMALGGINYFIAQLLPGALPFQINARLLGYTLAIAVVMALGIGALPVVHVLGGNLHRSIQGQSRGASTGRSARTMSSTLIVVQMAVALMLLIGAGLLMRSFANVLAVDPGFDPRHMLSARVALPMEYFQENRGQLFQQRLEASLREIPGVTVSLATATPFQMGLPLNAFMLRDYKLPPDAAQPGAFHLGASPSYLKTLRIPLLEGRWFNERDTAQSRQVYVVDEAFAKRYFSDRSAVGQHLSFGGPPQRLEDWPEIIGVVGNVRHNGVEEKSGSPYLYHPLTQTPFGMLSILIRTERPMPETLALMRRRIAAIDPALPVFKEEPMEEVIGTSFDSRRGIVWLLASFAGIALLLSAIGIYGVLAYDVSQRTREMGIRGAIGATGRQVVLLIVRQGLWKAASGVVLGLIGAFALSRFTVSLLYGVRPTDPLIYLLMSLLLLAVALLASYLPARRATEVDPLVALRAE